MVETRMGLIELDLPKLVKTFERPRVVSLKDEQSSW